MKNNKINFKKRKENLKSSLNDVKKFLYKFNKNLKYLKIYKAFK